jgi:hypothetical protein
MGKGGWLPSAISTAASFVLDVEVVSRALTGGGILAQSSISTANEP